MPCLRIFAFVFSREDLSLAYNGVPDLIVTLLLVIFAASSWSIEQRSVKAIDTSQLTPPDYTGENSIKCSVVKEGGLFTRFILAAVLKIIFYSCLSVSSAQTYYIWYQGFLHLHLGICSIGLYQREHVR